VPRYRKTAVFVQHGLHTLQHPLAKLAREAPRTTVGTASTVGTTAGTGKEGRSRSDAAAGGDNGDSGGDRANSGRRGTVSGGIGAAVGRGRGGGGGDGGLRSEGERFVQEIKDLCQRINLKYGHVAIFKEYEAVSVHIVSSSVPALFPTNLPLLRYLA